MGRVLVLKAWQAICCSSLHLRRFSWTSEVGIENVEFIVSQIQDLQELFPQGLIIALCSVRLAPKCTEFRLVLPQRFYQIEVASIHKGQGFAVLLVPLFRMAIPVCTH